MKKIFHLFLICFTLIAADEKAYAQGQTLIDSLLKELPKQKEDTNKVNVLNSLSKFGGWQIGNYDTALYYARNALQLAEKLGFKKGRANSYYNIGVVYYTQGNYPEALKNYFQAVKIQEEISDKKGIANSYRNIGIVYYAQSNYPEALKEYLSTLKIYEEIGDKNGIAYSYNNIGLVYAAQGNYPEALKNYFQAVKIMKEIGDKAGIANSYNNIGIVYYAQGNYPEALKNYFLGLKLMKEIGDTQGIAILYSNIGCVYAAQDNYSEALKNHFQALKIREEIGDKDGIANSYGNIGAVYAIQGNYPEALKNHFQALKISEAIGDKKGIAGSYNNIGTIYTNLHHAKEGEAWLQKGLALSKKIGSKENIKESYSGLAAADSALGNYKDAFENYKQYTVYKDSLYNEENTRKLTQTAMQYEFDKKQLADHLKNVQAQKLAKERLQKQSVYTYAGAGIAALLLAFSVFIFRNNKKLSVEKEKSENLLLNILPAEVADELKINGNAGAKYFDKVTVLFTDFVDFTKAGERMSPQELVSELHQCFKAFDEIIGKYDIEKIKTVGDAYLAVSGLPNVNAQHAQNIVGAARDIRNFMLARRAQMGNKTFEVRIGIHSGSVVAGIVGVKKFAYDIWGDTVNTAARMEQSGVAGKVNISETTYQLIKEDFTCEYRGELEAKNKGMLRMYFVG